MKGKQKKGAIYLQYIYLTNNLYAEKGKNADSCIIKQTTEFKKGKILSRFFHPKEMIFFFI